MGQEDSKPKNSASHSLPKDDEGHDDGESITEKRQTWDEKIAEQMKLDGINAEPVPPGSTTVENGPFYSQMFTSSFRMVINRGLIRVHGKNFDYVQILQRG